MLYALVVCLLVAADQALKYWTVTHLAVGQSAPLLPGVIRLTRLHNTGAAWSSLSGHTGLLTGVTAVLLVVVAALLVKRIVRHPLGVAACLLVLGGGVGNIIDRIVMDVSLFFTAVPSYWIAVILMLLFAVKLRVLIA